MSEMKTLKFPGDTEPREIVDAKAREDITRLSEAILASGSTVRYDITQTLDNTEKAQARANIGAGTSNFDGRYSSLTGKPTIPTKTSDLTNDSGFGTYSKPAGGIPKADLVEEVQTSLGKADSALQTHQSLAAYRKAAEQDVIDNRKQDKLVAGEGITIASDGKTISSSGKVSSVNGKTGTVNIYVEDIHYVKESQSLDTTIVGLKRSDAQMASDISELQTADASLDSRITAIETGDTPVTLYIYWASVVGGGRVSLTKDDAAMSVADFISKMQSGAKIIIGENNDTDSESSGFTNYRYKITDSTTASLAFDVANSFNGSNRTIIISGSSSTNGLMTGYQDIGHNDLSDYSPLPEGSTPASKAWVEDYVNDKVAALQSKSITDSGGYFTTDTVEGALQEIGMELAGINTLLGSGIQISFTIDGDPFSAVSGETWKEWIGGYSRVISEISGLTLYCFSDDGIIFADEAGVNALGLNDVWVHGNETIVSGATYAIIPCGG